MGGLSLHPAVRVGDSQGLPGWTRHQEWSEGTRPQLKVATVPPRTWGQLAFGGCHGDGCPQQLGKDIAAATAAAVCVSVREKDGLCCPPTPTPFSICAGRTAQPPKVTPLREAARAGGPGLPRGTWWALGPRRSLSAVPAQILSAPEGKPLSAPHRQAIELSGASVSWSTQWG